MKVVVAGATGLVGSALIERLSARHAVHALARSSHPSTATVEWHLADLSQRAETWSLPAQWDTTIYLAQSRGYRQFPERAEDMAAVNVQAVVSMLEVSRRRGAARFLLASTANVYGVSHDLIDERAELRPTSFYARTRRAAELLAESFVEHLDVIVARMFTIYGPGQSPDSLIASLIGRVTDGRAVQVQGARGLLLSPLYLSDAVDAIVQLIERPVGSKSFTIVNVAGPEVVGVGELASIIGTVVGRAPVIERTAGAEPGGWAGNTAVLRSLTGWMPRTPLERGLKDVIAARIA